MIIDFIHPMVVGGISIIFHKYASVILIGIGFKYSFFGIYDMLLTGNKHLENPH